MTELPMINEYAAVVIAQRLMDGETVERTRNSVEETLALVPHVKVVYEQNTAGELNIVVPGYSYMRPEAPIVMEMTDEQLAAVSGGDVIFGGLAALFTSIGLAVGVGSAYATIGAGGAVTVSLTATALTTFVGGLIVVGSMAVGYGLAAGIAAGIGVGISNAIQAGAASSSPVNIGLAS